MARDGQMNWLGSRYPNDEDELNTSSSLPIQMHPSYGKSLQAPYALETAPLIHIDLTGVLHGTGSTRPSKTAPISDAHP